MNSTDIEMGAVIAVKDCVLLHGNMDESINSNDKEPSWDGFIYLHSEKDSNTAENIIRIPVQIKGKNDESLLNKQYIPYSIKTHHLRNYSNDGGILYIVVVISNNKKKRNIFYKALSPVVLKGLLHDANAKSKQSKNIILTRLRDNNPNLLYRVLLQLNLDRTNQGYGKGPIVNHAIDRDQLSSVEEIKIESCISSSHQELLQQIQDGQLTVYGRFQNSDIWYPLTPECQREIPIRGKSIIEADVSIDGQTYYDCYSLEYASNKNPVVKFSDNLAFDITSNTYNFYLSDTINTLVYDICFLKTLCEGKPLFVNHQNVLTVNQLPQKLSELFQYIMDINNAFNQIGVVCDKRFDQMNEDDCRYVDALVDIYRGQYHSKDRSDKWIKWHWQGKTLPLFLTTSPENKHEVINWICSGRYQLSGTVEDSEYRLPGIIVYANILEDLVPIDIEKWKQSIDAAEICQETIPCLNQLLLDLISAYDKTQDELFINVADYLAEKMIRVSQEDYVMINTLQIKKRRQALDIGDEETLESILNQTDRLDIKCAVNILLDNKHLAKKLLAELAPDMQESFKMHPIYALMGA